MTRTVENAPIRGHLVPVVEAMMSTQRHSWEQGIVMQALDAIGARATMVAMAWESIAVTCVGDGRIGITPGPDEGSATDACACGISMGRAYALTRDDRFLRAVEGLEEWARNGAPRNAEGVVYHEVARRRFWVDSFFMLPPFLADRGHVDEALRQIRGYWDVLADPASGLLHHMWSEELGALEWPGFWATGHGWALAGLTQVIQRTSVQKDRAWLIGLVETLLEGMAPYQLSNGLFHNMVDQPDTFVDGAGAALMAYAVFTGVGDGWLPEVYADMAARALKGVRGRINAYGFVTGVPGAPNFEAPGISAEAQGAYVMAEAAAAFVNMETPDL